MAKTEAIQESVATNKAEQRFAEERQSVAELLGLSLEGRDNLVPTRDDWNNTPCPYALFAELRELDDETVSRILTFVVAETLPCGEGLCRGIGQPA